MNKIIDELELDFIKDWMFNGGLGAGMLIAYLFYRMQFPFYYLIFCFIAFFVFDIIKYLYKIHKRGY